MPNARDQQSRRAAGLKESLRRHQETPSQGARQAFRDPLLRARKRGTRDSRAARLSGDRCESAIDRADLYQKTTAGCCRCGTSLLPSAVGRNSAELPKTRRSLTATGTAESRQFTSVHSTNPVPSHAWHVTPWSSPSPPHSPHRTPTIWTPQRMQRLDESFVPCSGECSHVKVMVS